MVLCTASIQELVKYGFSRTIHLTHSDIVPTFQNVFVMPVHNFTVLIYDLLRNKTSLLLTNGWSPSIIFSDISNDKVMLAMVMMVIVSYK